jgi:hypothetical protein
VSYIRHAIVFWVDGKPSGGSFSEWDVSGIARVQDVERVNGKIFVYDERADYTC